jgi:hypothetical protein
VKPAVKAEPQPADIPATAICNRAIAADCRARDIDAQSIAANESTIAANGQTIGIYLQTIGNYSQTIAIYIQAMPANIGEIHSARHANAARSRAMAGNSGFPHKSALCGFCGVSAVGAKSL